MHAAACPASKVHHPGIIELRKQIHPDVGRWHITQPSLVDILTSLHSEGHRQAQVAYDYRAVLAVDTDTHLLSILVIINECLSHGASSQVRSAYSIGRGTASGMPLNWTSPWMEHSHQWW